MKILSTKNDLFMDRLLRVTGKGTKRGCLQYDMPQSMANIVQTIPGSLAHTKGEKHIAEVISISL